jgi:hypothetical protein
LKRGGIIHNLAVDAVFCEPVSNNFPVDGKSPGNFLNIPETHDRNRP